LRGLSADGHALRFEPHVHVERLGCVVVDDRRDGGLIADDEKRGVTGRTSKSLVLMMSTCFHHKRVRRDGFGRHPPRREVVGQHDLHCAFPDVSVRVVALQNAVS